MGKVGAVLAVFAIGYVTQVVNAVVTRVAVDVIDLINRPCSSVPRIYNPAVAGLHSVSAPRQMNAPSPLV
jgi:hypothetical protein